jgi:nitrite reductase (NAD(P)H)
MQHSGKHPTLLGCEVCEPAYASILTSLFNQHVMDKPVHTL